MKRNCESHAAILAPLVYSVPFIHGSVLSRNGVSFLTMGVLKNLDWWNLVRGLIGLKDRSKRSLYWLVCVSALYKHLGNLCTGQATSVCPCCSVVREHDKQHVCGLLIIPSFVSKVSTLSIRANSPSFPNYHVTSLQPCVFYCINHVLIDFVYCPFNRFCLASCLSGKQSVGGQFH